MRTDAIGFFWEDLPPPPKVKKEKIKRTPPERVWERLDYLPGLEEALNARYDLFTVEELLAASANKEPLVYDIECYPNYYLIAFRSIVSGKYIYFEMYLGHPLQTEWLNWVLHNFTIISFNGLGYDEAIATLSVAGYDNAELKKATDQIILEDWRSYDILKARGLKRLKLDHIDIMEVAPGAGGLKLRAARLHRKRLQDLPFPPNMLLTPNHIAIVRHYCINDLDATEGLYQALRKDIDLRIILGKEYDLDLRSRSDAQIAEDVFRHEICRELKIKHIQKPKVMPGMKFQYKIPHFLKYQTPMMNSVMDVVRNCYFTIEDNGTVKMAWQLEKLEIRIANGIYRMGIGGLHSSEEKAAHPYVKGRRKRDIDVTSYYPSIILNQGMYPPQLGKAFLKIFGKIVKRRVHAKHTGDASTAQTLKIVINGTFGKLGSVWSMLYAPELLIQTTLTGQLSLLMLIEMFELAGIQVLSANTDGIVVDYALADEPKVEAIIKWWEQQTNFEMESNFYKCLYSANVNNYIAITEEGKLKCKGWFAETGLQKSPAGEIIFEAVRRKLKDGTPIEQTIKECKDITKFLVVRQVKGGAYWNGQYLGKVVRWYYGEGEVPEMVYAMSGNKVTNSTNGIPMMELQDELPSDLNYDMYIEKANGYLEQLGYL